MIGNVKTNQKSKYFKSAIPKKKYLCLDKVFRKGVKNLQFADVTNKNLYIPTYRNL